MIGTKPKDVLIVRDFRGTRLFLASLHINQGMRWTVDKAVAQRFQPDEALAVSERASREWGTKCAVIDATGTMLRKAAPATKRTPGNGVSGVVKITAQPSERCVCAMPSAHTAGCDCMVQS